MTDKCVMVTTAYGEGKKLLDVSGPRMIEYCKNHDIEFVAQRDGSNHFNMWEHVFRVAEKMKADRLCMIDADILIAKGSPNIFDETREADFWACKADNVHAAMKSKVIREKFDPNFREDHYQNYSNIIVNGKTNILKLLETVKTVDTKGEGEFDQQIMNPAIRKLGMEVRTMPYKWSVHMPRRPMRNYLYKEKDFHFFHAIGEAKMVDFKAKVERLRHMQQEMLRNKR